MTTGCRPDDRPFRSRFDGNICSSSHLKPLFALYHPQLVVSAPHSNARPTTWLGAQNIRQDDDQECAEHVFGMRNIKAK